MRIVDSVSVGLAVPAVASLPTSFNVTLIEDGIKRIGFFVSS